VRHLRKALSQKSADAGFSREDTIMEPDLIAYVPGLEHDELDRRLRNLTWTVAPPETKLRGLEAIRRVARAQASATAAPVERVERFELTRWTPALRTMTWAAPRRPPRFAITL
jgi:hypothetical protein